MLPSCRWYAKPVSGRKHSPVVTSNKPVLLKRSTRRPNLCGRTTILMFKIIFRYIRTIFIVTSTLGAVVRRPLDAENALVLLRERPRNVTLIRRSAA